MTEQILSQFDILKIRKLILRIFEIVVVNLLKRGLRVYCMFTLQLLLTRVSSKKGKSFAKISHFFTFRSLAKNAKKVIGFRGFFSRKILHCFRLIHSMNVLSQLIELDFTFNSLV